VVSGRLLISERFTAAVGDPVARGRPSRLRPAHRAPAALAEDRTTCPCWSCGRNAGAAAVRFGNQAVVDEADDQHHKHAQGDAQRANRHFFSGR
jgi:hypothetical protein